MGWGGYSHLLAIRVCAAGKGMVFKPFTLGLGLIIIENWFRGGSRLTIAKWTKIIITKD